MTMALAARSRDHDNDPAWVASLGATEDPTAVYARTYSAIAAAATAARRRRSRWRTRLWIVSPLLVVAITVALLQIAPRPLRLPFELPFTLPSPRVTLAPALEAAGRALASVRDAPALEAAREMLARYRSAIAPDAAPASPAVVPRPAPATIIGTTPARPKASLRVGEVTDFAVAAAGPGLRYGWTVDGAPAGTGPRWTFAPGPTSLGRRLVEVTVQGDRTVERRAWHVRVRPARAPAIVAARPGAAEVETEVGIPFRLSVDARPGTDAERLVTTWFVDERPAAAGPAFALRRDQPGTVLVRARVASDLGGVATRVWRVHVVEPPAETAPPVRTASAAPTRAPAAAPRVREAPRAALDGDVRRWLARYAAAWRAHDVEALRRMGQVATDGEAAALRRYFGAVRDLDVDLDLISLREQGERMVVRFTRRDRFRDPAGRLVLKESPPIEKEIVRTSDGLRFARP
jgi:hypothetical protein